MVFTLKIRLRTRLFKSTKIRGPSAIIMRNIIKNALQASLPILFLAISPAVLAQGNTAVEAKGIPALPPSPAPPPSGPTLLNGWLRDQSPVFNSWDFGGQLRAREDHRENTFTPGHPGQVDFRDQGGDPDNTYLLLRARVHAGFISSWLSVYAEGQESSSTADRRNPNLESDLFDLHQAYLTLGDPAKLPLMAKVGRQELAYGDERLIGTADWNNIGRVCDAVKVRFTAPGSWVDAFYSRPVIPRDNLFDTSNDYDNFSGVYGSTTKGLPWQETQVYFLARNTTHNSPNFETGALGPLPSPRDIYTIGFRLKSLPGKLGGWDYTVEGDYQFGRYASVTGSVPNAVVGRSREQQAYAVHLDGGYTWSKTWSSPRLGMEFNYASGDRDTRDNKHQTFDTLYPSTHLFSGAMDLFSLQNMTDVGIFATLKPLPRLTVVTSYRAFWLAETSDSFYLGNGAPRTGGAPGAHNGYAINPTYDSYIGSELDLTFNYAVTPYALLQAGVGHFFVGDYVRQSLSAPGIGFSDGNYLYLQTRFTF
jgi:hypothetical protein